MIGKGIDILCELPQNIGTVFKETQNLEYIQIFFFIFVKNSVCYKANSLLSCTCKQIGLKLRKSNRVGTWAICLLDEEIPASLETFCCVKLLRG
jgi:hypothetical protein